MIGERENFDTETKYGSLTMRPYDIDGNEISAFYDAAGNLVFVLDNTINARKPNVLLVVNPSADKKWDEILAGDYGVDLETIRPKQDNKYQKLDIEYSGLSVYDNLIKAYNSGDSLEEPLNQLAILRNSAARHSAMTRLNVANEIIAKTNTTIVKTKESIVRLQARLKTLRAKLAEAKKGIGRMPTKQSAAKILKLEAQIDATNEKIKRANERLKSAQRRLETATVDAELASELLNQPSEETFAPKRYKPVVVAAASKPRASVAKVEQEEPKEEVKEEVLAADNNLPSVIKDDDNIKDGEDVDDDFEDIEDDDFVDEEDDDIDDIDEDIDEDVDVEEDIDEDDKEKDDNHGGEDKVKPLFDKDPQILNEDIAFKPISFNPPSSPELSQQDNRVPDLNREMLLTDETDTKEETETTEEEIHEDIKETEEVPQAKSVLESMMPIAIESKAQDEIESEPEDTEVEAEEIEEEPGEKEETEMVIEEPLRLQKPVENIKETRQQEPVIAPELDISIKEDEFKTEDEMLTPQTPIAPSAPTTPVPPMPVPPYSMANVNVMKDDETNRRRPSFIYYLLLIVLIVMAVFTLWLYQRNVEPTAPVLTTTVENTETVKDKTSFFKKSDKPKRQKSVVKEEVEAPTFVDDVPAKEATVPVALEPEPVVVHEEIVETEPANVVPQVIDAVPARLSTSGMDNTAGRNVASEEDVLANKPEYQPGSRHDEMFVAEEYIEDGAPVEYVEEEIICVDEEDNVVECPEDFEYEDGTEYVHQEIANNPYFDAEEAAYQAEQQSGM